MELKIRESKINDKEPFKDDLLNRKPEIESLSKLVTNCNTPLVLSINSEWGTGKTTFIKMWQAYLKQENQISIYFNAWESDFVDDPLVVFLSEINSQIKKIDDSSDQKELWDNIQKAIPYIGKKLIPLAIRLLTSGIIDLEKTVEKTILDFTESLGKEAVEYYSKTKSEIESFKENLFKYINSFVEQKRIIIFIDELDRCRPTYAIELLERIKHILNIENIVFVLSMDKTQLGHSIKALYGNNFDSINYLTRFIDLEHNLRDPKFIEQMDFSSSNKPNIKKFIENSFYKLKINELVEISQFDALVTSFGLFSEILRFNLRNIEQLITKLSISLLSIDKNIKLISQLLIFLLIINIKEPKLYSAYIKSNFDPTELIAYLHDIVPKKELFYKDNYTYLIILGSLLGEVNSFERDEIIKLIRQKYEDTSLLNESKDIFYKKIIKISELEESNPCVTEIINSINFLNTLTVSNQ